jgi:DNA-binding beta-propeller fold protein YncE
LVACRDEPAAAAPVYEWIGDWPRLPAGRELGYTHGGIAFDASGRIYVESDAAEAVLVFDPGGNLVDTLLAELAGGLHGIWIAKEGDEEFLYLTHIRRGAVYKATLAGEIVWQLGCPLESGLYERPEQYHPTSIAVAPDGSFYVADGYGLSYVHRYDAGRRYLGSFGGRGPGTGKEKGELRNPHGLWLDAERQELWVADRENRRLQVFDLEGRALSVLDRRTTGHDLGRPCFVEARGDELLVADIEGRVMVLSRRGELLAELGKNPDPATRDRNDIPRAQQAAGIFHSPHCARWDDEGNVYVVEWLLEGRLTKLARRLP